MSKEEIKALSNLLQCRLCESTKSDNVLYIFDSKYKKDKYEKYLKEKHINTPDKILMTADNLLYGNGLDGLRFQQFWFVTDEDLEANDVYIWEKYSAFRI